MENSLSEFIEYIINAVIFCTAIGIIIFLLSTTTFFNKGEIKDQNNKSSITMDTELGYSEDLIYVKGSEVFTNIMNQDESLPIYLNGTQLSSDYIKNLKEKDKTYINDLKSIVSFDDEYIIKHTYNSKNEIEAVYYEHR